ncbi:MAG: glucosamine-6-phosphate deaminase, partial [Verrucomicrobiae bacterium]|nr:glucosamine-6-phosphate deaminase [Verrucomicrobiae bacterium]
MEVIIQPDAINASRLAATIVGRLVREKPTAVLGLATGNTPKLLYNELARLHRDHALDFSQVATFNLDEYIGIGPKHV